MTVFDPSMSVSSINAALNAPAGGARRQFFFMPGTYGTPGVAPPVVPGGSAANVLAAANAAGIISAPIGANTVVSGLGQSPCDVVIHGALFVVNGGLSITARQLQNMTIDPVEANTPVDTMHWVTSQTAVWRRVNLLGNVEIGNLETGNQSFGAMITNSNITGQLLNGNSLNTSTTSVQPDGDGGGSNAMYYVQGSDVGGLTGWAGLIQFAGVNGAPPEDFGPGGQVGNLDRLPVVRESPFVYYDTAASQFKVFSPGVQFDRRGYDWSLTDGRSLPLSDFYVANPADPVATLNAQLAAGKNLLLNPGNYTQDAPLTIDSPSQIVLGLGIAQLTANAGVQSVKVASGATGTILAGFTINAAALGGATPADFQVQIGTTNIGTGLKSDPTTLSDISIFGKAVTAEVINQDYVLQSQGEYDGGQGAALSGPAWAAPDGSYGLVVNSDHVTWQGLWVEHYKKTQIIWNGDGGRIQFLENEPPYTPYFTTNNVTPDTWQLSPDFVGYPTLAIDPNVANFRMDGYVTATRFSNGCRCEITASITTPNKPGILLKNLFAANITFPVAAGLTNVHYDPNEQNGESGQLPRFWHPAPGVTAPLAQFSGTGGFISQSGYYAVGGPRSIVGILNADGTITPNDQGNLIPDVDPGPSHAGPGGTSKLPYSDSFGFSVTTRIAQFPAPTPPPPAPPVPTPSTTGGSTSTPSESTPTPAATPGPSTPSAPTSAPARSSKPKVSARFAVGKSVTRVRSLRVTGLGDGGTVGVSCDGRGCPKEVRVVDVHRGTANVASTFRGSELKPGVRITVTVVAEDGKTLVVTYKTRKGRSPVRA